LTPWKAESLWQLYVSTANYLSRSLDEERIHMQAHDRQFVERILPLLQRTPAPAGVLNTAVNTRADAADAAGATGASVDTARELSIFLEGLPRRYVLAHSPAEVAKHFGMARKLDAKSVQVDLEKRDHVFVLTLLATDRPRLFAGITGTLAAWGMNIWKAEAFANAAGLVVDTFRFTDPHSTLELNPTEVTRLHKNIVDVLAGGVSVDELMRGRASLNSTRTPKVSVTTSVNFDETSSSHSTLMEMIAQDRPGLLYRVSSALASTGCNIEVALIDTEGERALDSFYLTVDGAKLSAAHQEQLRQALLEP
jgi:[protein-PII] uridylyltransferase